MSAMMSWIDWMSLLDLLNTPDPNQPYQSRHEDFFAQLAEALDEKNEKKFCFLARQWVLYHAGISDADQGRRIHNYANRFMDEWYANKTGPDVRERFRKAIWGRCNEGGRDWNNFQPCTPKLSGISKTLSTWTQRYTNEMAKHDVLWAKKFTAARITLSDKARTMPLLQFKYTVLAASERLDCPFTLLYAGLHGEF